MIRWIVAIGGSALALTLLAVATILRFLIPVTMLAPDEASASSEELDAYYAATQTAYIYYQVAPWVVAAALIALVATLVLAAYRAQLVAASATAARDVRRELATSAGDS